MKKNWKFALTKENTSIKLLVYPVNGRVLRNVRQRADTEWEVSGNSHEEAHPGGSFLKTVGKDGEPPLWQSGRQA